jgi:hypothetical protein
MALRCLCFGFDSALRGHPRWAARSLSENPSACWLRKAPWGEPKPLFEQPVEIGGVSEAAAIGYIGDRGVNITGLDQSGAGPLQAAVSQIVAEANVVLLKQLLQIALRNPLVSSYAAGRQVRIMQAPFDRERHTVEERDEARRRRGGGSASRATMVKNRSATPCSRLCYSALESASILAAVVSINLMKTPANPSGWRRRGASNARRPAKRPFTTLSDRESNPRAGRVLMESGFPNQG